ncbi:hypothetical protein JTE90_014989 [Oedothorax gibbosus]|uniref:Uncharacterized protein n=1 Tax=Oedothorax gibbosus TaxID=931172 RepID=A0AAV6UX10_9ARAC|nr:hypothetical protein JTE90_014989 [Oedothorax gibbosus]
MARGSSQKFFSLVIVILPSKNKPNRNGMNLSMALPPRSLQVRQSDTGWHDEKNHGHSIPEKKNHRFLLLWDHGVAKTTNVYFFEYTIRKCRSKKASGPLRRNAARAPLPPEPKMADVLLDSGDRGGREKSGN